MTTSHSCDQRLCFGRPLLLGLLCPLFTCFVVPGKKTPFSSKCWSSPLGHWVCHKQNLKFETGSLLGRLLQHNMKLYFSAGSSRRDSSCLLHSQNPMDKPIIGISTYNVVPYEAGQYFNKIQVGLGVLPSLCLLKLEDGA